MTYSNVVSTICLFVVLGGGAYAATQINGGDLKPRSVAGKKLRKNTLGGTEIKESRLGRVPHAASAARLGSLTEADVQTRLLWARYDYLFKTSDPAPPPTNETHGLDGKGFSCAQDDSVIDYGPPARVPNPDERGCELLRVYFTANPTRDLRRCAYTATTATKYGGRVEEIEAYSGAFGATPGIDGRIPGTDEVVVDLELENGYYDKTSLAPGLSLQVVCP